MKRVTERAESSESFGRGSGSREPGDQPIEMRRHLDALRRERVFIALFVAVMTAVAVTASLVLPKTYRAKATIVYDASAANPLGTTDVATVERTLETFNRLLGTPDVLDRVAVQMPNETRGSLSSKVSSSVDPSANIISITAFDRDPAEAASIATTVAKVFLERQQEAERARLANARQTLVAQLGRVRALGANAETVRALQERISALSVEEVNAGSELQLAQEAEVPSAAYSPRPVRNGVLAFFASIFLAVLVALGRDRLVPRVGSQRELSRLMGFPVLVNVPFVRRRLGVRRSLVRAVANDAYQTLQASVRFQLPPTTQRVVLVTSAVAGEGKTTVATGLARALARVGQKSLVVCADLRFPTLHQHFDLDRAPGLVDILAAGGIGGRSRDTMRAALRRTLASSATGFESAVSKLDVIPSGSRTSDPAELLFSGAVDAFFEIVAELPYHYVIVDGPPMLGIADSHLIAQRADGVLLVSRLDQVQLEDSIELRDLLERLEVDHVGLVVVGARRAASSYAYAMQ